MISAIRDVTRNLEHIFKTPNADICSKCTAYSDEKGNEHNRGCCRNCASMYGHFHKVNDGIDGKPAAKLLKNYWWDDVYGYFNPIDMRCGLPREYRSVVCLSFMCAKVHDSLDVASVDTLNSINNLLFKYRRSNKGWLKEMMEHEL
jgi:hypothetical protein